jgi:hypothetical protein
MFVCTFSHNGRLAAKELWRSNDRKFVSIGSGGRFFRYRLRQCVVGAGAVVAKDIAIAESYVGNPAWRACLA